MPAPERRSSWAYAARTWPVRSWSGMRVLERNWRCRLGEVYIGAAEADGTVLTLVFCEVKCRSGLGFGHPLKAITYAKIRTVRQLAALWPREHRMKASSIRLDAIGVVLAPGQEPSVTQFPQRLVSSLGSAADHLGGRCRRHGLKAGMRAQIAIPGLAYPLRLLGPQIISIQLKRRGTGD
jgi:putative endonuclease